MNTVLWVLQSLMALTFLIPGICKLIFSEDELVAKGFTGVEGFALPLILVIGISEVLGAIGIIIPMLLDIFPLLSIVSAIGFALIMVAAAIVSYKRGDYNKFVPIIAIFLICVFIVYGRTTLMI